MDILIPDNWLRDFLKTKATPQEMAKYLSLSGPSIEKIIQSKSGPVYLIEVTTNRVDSASVYGIGREAAAILPQFGFKAKLVPLRPVFPGTFTKKVNYLTVTVDHQLCPRFTAVLIRDTQNSDSPAWLKERLLAVGVRPINNIVDISNYIMHELGQPVHTFDYDKIRGAKMILRKSRPGEKITTLDNKTHNLSGGDIVIEDGEGRLIDLAGIMGGLNSAVEAKTKNVLLFVQIYNPVNIRKTSMTLAQRTEAAMLFEKGLDSELVKTATLRALELFEKITKGKAEKEILDLYPNPYQGKKVSLDFDLIKQKLGLEIPKTKVVKILNSLSFETFERGKNLEIQIPSFRARDINIPEDILEEIARIYGYHNLPSQLMAGRIPDPLPDTPFDFEQKVKNILKSYGANEVYTLSLVSQNQTTANSLKLKNPLGTESEFLRTTLMFSLISAAKKNLGNKDPFHLFEMANIYLPRKSDLPEEKMMLAGIFANTQYREAKGIIESFLEELNISSDLIPEDARYFLPKQRLSLKTNGNQLGQFGTLEQNGLIYYEFNVDFLRKAGRSVSYKPIPKNPPQIEDLTLIFPAKTKIGEVIKTISSIRYPVAKVELKDIYNNAYTFRIWYQHPDKTLSDAEVRVIRKKVLTTVKQKFGGIPKD